MVDRIRAFVAAANRDIDVKRIGEKLELTSDRAKLTLEKGFSANELSAAPDLVTSVWYSYSAGWGTEAPIENVTIRLADYSREVAIDGISLEQVDGLIGLIEEELGARRTLLGGDGLRTIGGSLLLIVAWSSLAFAAQSTNLRTQIALLAAAVTAFAAVVLPPWSAWLPGLAIFPNEASWLVRNSPLLTLLGVIVTILTFAASTAYTARLAHSSRTGSVDRG